MDDLEREEMLDQVRELREKPRCTCCRVVLTLENKVADICRECYFSGAFDVAKGESDG